MKSRSNYTLLEILSAMAVFMIICLVVVRFFAGAQKLTSSTNSYNEMYADVRAFFDVIGNDLQTIVYNNSVSTSGVQPFVLSYYDITDTSTAGHFKNYLTNFENFYHKDIIPKRLHKEMLYEESSARKFITYVPILCFIANPSNMPGSTLASGPTCEVRYTFVPIGARPEIPPNPPSSSKPAIFPYRTLTSPFGMTATADSVAIKQGGKILRSITYETTSKPSTPNYNINRHPSDYDIFPIVDESGNPVQESGATDHKRIEWVFGDNSSYRYEEVIGHVYRMNITCFKLEADSSGVYSYRKYKLMNMSTGAQINTIDPSNGSITEAAANYIDWMPNDLNSRVKYPDNTTDVELTQLGHPLPDMIRVDLYMLSPLDWNLMMSYYDWRNENFSDKGAANKLLERKLRHFSRIFYINIK